MGWIERPGAISRPFALDSDAMPYAKTRKSDTGTKNPHAVKTMNSEVWWALFVALGPTRSLPAVREYGIANGLRTPSIKSLRSWSARDGWIARAFEADAKVKPVDLTIGDAIAEMNTRQATTARAMLAVVDRSLDKQKDGVVALDKLPEVLSTSTRVERLAMGASTDRHEVSMAFVERMAPRIVEIFIQVNILPDAEARATQFLEAMNGLAGEFVSSSG